jgi:hypothetical protein
MPSSPFPDSKPVEVKVTTGRDLAEVFLSDHEFALVARGVGSLEATVEPGVYKVKAKLGDARVERLVVLNEDETIDLSAELRPVTPAPLEDTARTHHSQAALAVDESSTIDVHAGKGAQVFLLARRWTPDPARMEAGGQGLCNMSLHSLEGEKIADLLDEKTPSEPQEDAAAGFTVTVDPALYLLRWSDPFGATAEQVVTALAGWQTQAFLLEEEVEGAPNPHELSVLMSQHPFSYSDPSLQIAEEARTALAEERRVATSFISASLFGDFGNPMLGLFGAHLMLIAGEALEERSEREAEGETAMAPPAPVGFDQALFDEVVSKLAALFGEDHPDVVALATKASQASKPPPLRCAPMLWRSWRLLIEASNQQPDLVPPDLWRRTLGTLPMRPFLTWSPETSSALVPQWEEQLSASLQPAQLPEEGRSQLSEQLLAPRAVIDEAVDQKRAEPLS